MNAIQTQAVIEFMNEYGAENVHVAVPSGTPMWYSGPYYIECQAEHVIYYMHGNKHRDKGRPAVVGLGGACSWYEHGKYIKSCTIGTTS
jgi:hypothetical protein